MGMRLLSRGACDAMRSGMPSQYRRGRVSFAGLDLRVARPVLIPRPETEQMVLWTLGRIPADCSLRIVDLCSGNGCIALALARWLPKSRVYGVDFSPVALELAEDNRRRLGITNLSFHQHDLLSAPPSALLAAMGERPVDLIVSNPPYIPPQELSSLPPSVRDWEDRNALIAGEEGLAFYNAIIQRIAPLILSNSAHAAAAAEASGSGSASGYSAFASAIGLDDGFLAELNGTPQELFSSPCAKADTDAEGAAPPVPRMVCEVGSREQGRAVASLLLRHGIASRHGARLYDDLYGRARWVSVSA